ncbi:MAG: soluble cytochrome b562 [Chthoniobacter sp.]|jgi:hypothetical protein|nr:soluble cytochrome b562 [Chthoniobacter sp.]
MKKMSFRSGLFATFTAFLMPLAGWAQGPAEQPQPSPGRDRPRGGPREGTPVGKQMEAVQSSFRKLNRQYADPAQKASSMELIATMQKGVETAKTLMPSKAEKLNGEEKKKYLDTFHKDLDELAQVLVALKDDMEAGDNAKTKADLDKIGQMKNTSHKELGVGGGGGPRGQGGPGGPGGRGPRDESGGASPAPSASPHISPAL